MQIFKRMTILSSSWILALSVSVLPIAQTNTAFASSNQQKLEQKEKEKQSINSELNKVQREIDSLNSFISKNQTAMADTLDRISATNQLIEKKKEEIVTLEDNILARKEVMKKRVVALQHDGNVSFIIDVLIDAKSIGDFIDRASAVSTILNADKNILGALEDDLNKIEESKKEIDRQQKILLEEQTVLAKQQANLNSSLKAKEKSFTVMKTKYSQIESQISQVQNQIQREQQEAKRRAALFVSAPNTPAPIGKGVELYVTSTAYSPEETGSHTALGYNIKENPNMKLIAVDPSVIPLGKKVWVEGYGEAIAGDVGSAIVGHKIDVLMPTKAAALAWGRRTVKIIILN